uniref:Reverse transcriptase zinc-binding domain-containing protein n=1 Tax=Poecilia reticulata TaxID=8081 RepID=A0A3P9PXL0_POERE
MRGTVRSRKEENIISRLRFGHTGLNSALFKIGKHPSGNCDFCFQEETVKHVLLLCLKYSEERRKLECRLLKNKDQRSSLMKPPGSILRIAGLEDTIYRDKPEEVDGWGMFYLPEEVNMRVLGVVEGLSNELVLMTCEDRKLYAYDEEELHLVALNLQALEYGEIKYPSTESYYNGQAFEGMTEEDWVKVKKGDVGRKLDQEHKKLVDANKASFLESLKSQK